MEIGEAVYAPSDDLFDRSLGNKEEKNYPLIFFTKLPKAFRDDGYKYCENELFHMIERMFKEIIFEYDRPNIHFHNTNVGFAGRTFNIPNIVKEKEAILDVVLYELSGEPVQKGTELWMDMIAAQGSRIEYRKAHHGYITGTHDRAGIDQKHPILTQLHIEEIPSDQFADLIWCEVDHRTQLQKAVMLLNVKPLYLQDVSENDPGMNLVMRKLTLVGNPKQSPAITSKAADLIKEMQAKLDLNNFKPLSGDFKNYSPLGRFIAEKPNPINSLNFNPFLGEVKDSEGQ